MERTDRGQALPLVAIVMVFAGIACLVVGHVAGAATERGRAKTAADAVALAGAGGGEAAARQVASANGARLVRYRENGDETTVEVAVGRARAGSRAVRRGDRGSPAATGLAPALRAALARAEQLLGRPVPITSGFRTRAQQQALWDRRGSNPYPVAQPGSSMHERGLAVDVPTAFLDRLVPVARQAGLCRPYPKSDPVHFELCGPG